MSERARSWIRGAGDALRSRFTAKEKPPETIDSMRGEDMGDFESRLEKMARERDVVGTYHYRDFATKCTVPKGTKCEQIHLIFLRQAKEDNDMLMKSEGAQAEKEDAPAHVEPLKPTEDMTDNLVDIDEFMASLDTLDFGDIEEVLKWCISFGESRSRDDMHRFKDRILAKFAAHGYVPGMNIGPKYKADDRDNAGGYIVGNALSSIKEGEEQRLPQIVFNSIMRRQYDEWREKFETRPTTQK